MIKVKRMDRGDMHPPRPFIRDLKLIDPNFSVIWLTIGQKFAIISPAPISIFRKGYVVEYLVESPNGEYAPLDGRVIRELQFLMWEKNHLLTLDHHLLNQKKRERERIERMNRQTKDSFREAEKIINNAGKKKTFT